MQGIPAKIDKGKVAIQRETTFSRGDEISADLGIMLAKLGVNPIEIGLILTGAIEEGHIFQSSDLDLDTDGLRNDVVSGLLVLSIWHATSGGSPPLQLQPSSQKPLEALSVAVEAGVLNDALLLPYYPKACSVPSRTIRFLSFDEELQAALGAASQML